MDVFPWTCTLGESFDISRVCQLDSYELLTTSFSKMSKLSVLFLSVFVFCTSYCRDYTKTDYCKLNKDTGNCVEGSHSACNCTIVQSRFEVRGDDSERIANFRLKILEVHNEYRNWIASGYEIKIPQAANMMVLNYDMELEHIARCRALNSFEPYEDESCQYDSKNDTYGQNVYGSSLYQERVSAVDSYIKYWYDQIELVDESVISEFHESYSHEHFTQMVWAETTHIGCVRVWNEEAKSSDWRMVVICNYKRAGNVHKKPVYKKGASCSACPGGTKCETGKYPALCGKLLTATGRELIAKSDRVTQNWVIIIASSVSIAFLLY